MGALDFLSDYFTVTPKKKHKPMQVFHKLLCILFHLCL